MRSLRSLRTLFQTVTTMTIACGGATTTEMTDGGKVSDSGVDRTGFDLSVCDGTTYKPTSGLTPAKPVDYVELRVEQPSFTDAMPAKIEKLDSTGVACQTATMKPACEGKLASLRTGAGWNASSSFGGGPQVQQFEYVAFTRADEVGAVTSAGALTTFLAPLETAQDAAIVAYANGHRIVCDGRPNARKTAEGFELITRTGYTCGGPGLFENVILVSENGSITVKKQVLTQAGDDMCAIGRRPEGLVTHAPSRGGVGAFFAAAAHLEAASVASFERLARELRAHGAPEELISAALAAARDEVRHTSATRAIAERYGARAIEPCVEERDVRDLFTIALENATEGCVRETYGALVATYQAARAKDPRIARVMKRIALDETKHAELSWSVARWAESRLSPEELAELRQARAQAASELRAELASEPEPSLRELAGMPSARDARALFDGVADELWAA